MQFDCRQSKIIGDLDLLLKPFIGPHQDRSISSIQSDRRGLVPLDQKLASGFLVCQLQCISGLHGKRPVRPSDHIDTSRLAVCSQLDRNRMFLTL